MLTRVERTHLRQIAEMLRRDDRRLARLLTRRGSPHPITVGVATLVVGVVLTATITLGVLLRLPPLCAAGWTGVTGLAILRAMYADRPD